MRGDGMGAIRGREDWRGETEKPWTAGQGEGEGWPGTWGAWMERGMKPARFGTDRAERGRQ